MGWGSDSVILAVLSTLLRVLCVIFNSHPPKKSLYGKSHLQMRKLRNRSLK